MMQSHLPHWVDKNVATQLVDVARGASQSMTSHDQPSVRPPSGEPPDRRPPAASHPVGAIEGTRPINQHGPRKTHLANVLFGALSSLKRDNYNAPAQRG